MSRSLYHLTDDYHQLMVLAENAEDNEELERVLSEAFEQLDDEIGAKIDSCACVIAEWKRHAEAAKAEADRLANISKSYASKIDSLKTYMQRCMESLGKDRIDGDRFKVSIRKGSQRVEIISEDDVPAPYLLPQPPKIDKRKIGELLKEKGDQPFAKFVRGDDSITIR